MKAIGDMLDGQYRLDRKIGAGPHGDVFEATEIDLGRSVAVKILHSDIDRARLEREAQHATRLDGRFSVPVLLAKLDHDPPFVVSELARGPALSTMLDEPLPRARAIEIIRGILEALEHAHEQRVFHGDLRPPNVFVGKRGVQLADFGFATDDTQEGRSATDLLSTKSAVGYRAPERLRGASPDVGSDLFAVGVMAFELFAGRRPFDRGAPVDEIAAILGTPAPKLPPGPVADVIARALEKNPAKRFASAREMRDALGKKGLWPYAIAVAIALPISIAVWAALEVKRIDQNLARDAGADVVEAPIVSASASAEAPVVSSSPPSNVAPPRAVASSSRVRVQLLETPQCKFGGDEAKAIGVGPAIDACYAKNGGGAIGDSFTYWSPPEPPSNVGFVEASGSTSSERLGSCIHESFYRHVPMKPLLKGCRASVTVVR